MIRASTFVAGIILGAACAASACKVINPNHTIVQKAQENAATYHAKVEKSETGTACGSPARLLTLKVIKAFGVSALPGETVVVSSATGDCGSSYAVGAEVVIFVDVKPGCTGPGSQSTGEASFNEVSPSKAQLDSLYQRPTAVAEPAGKSSHVTGRAENRKGMTFARPGIEAEHRSDGRRVTP